MRVDNGTLVKGGLRAIEKAAFPTSVEWLTWWKMHERRIMDGECTGWEKAIAHGIGRLMDNQLTLARMIRFEGEGKKMIRYNPDGAVFGEETRSPEEITREAFGWWLHGGARDALLKQGTDKPVEGVPDWAATLAKAVEGCFIQQVRLGMELTAIKKKGYLVTNASATKRMPTEKEIHDHGVEAVVSRFSETDREDA